MEEQFSHAAAQKDVINLLSATNDKTSSRRRNTLSRREILRGFNVFNEVYAKGKSLYASFISCRIVEQKEISNQHLPTDIPVLVGFSVSSSVSTAVARNRLKRLMRETFRTQKHKLIECCVRENLQLILLFSFYKKTELPLKKFPFLFIDKDMNELLAKIVLQISVRDKENNL
mgnify:FL=1